MHTSIRLSLLMVLTFALMFVVSACTTMGPVFVSPANFDRAAEPASYTQTIQGTNVSYGMASIPGGLFVMGSPADEAGRLSDEGPRHRVVIEPFWMGEHEVTWDEYKRFRREYTLSREENRAFFWRKEAVPAEREYDAITAPTPMYQSDDTDKWYPGVKTDGQRPAVNITEFAARQYTKWLSKKTGHFYRLPTETEWEYACRAGSSDPYSFGSDVRQLGQYAWYLDNAGGSTHRVGTKRPNAWGLYDMHGNAAEWVIDGYDRDAYLHRPGTAVRNVNTITWPTQRYGRIVRGGHFDSEPARLRSATRDSSSPQWHRNDYVNNPCSIHWFTDAPFVGFRVVRPVIEPTDVEKQRFWDADNDEIRRGLLREVSLWFTLPGVTK